MATDYCWFQNFDLVTLTSFWLTFEKYLNLDRNFWTERDKALIYITHVYSLWQDLRVSVDAKTFDLVTLTFTFEKTKFTLAFTFVQKETEHLGYKRLGMGYKSC